MKYLICLVLISVSIASVFAVAGQSACRDRKEVGETFPNHFDPTTYWYCEKFGEPAISKECPKDTAYMHLLKECIPWASWIWKKPENPLTLA